MNTLSNEEITILSDKLLRFFLKRGIHSKDDAHDLVQETFLRLLKYLHEGHKIDCIEAYAIGVGKHVYMEYLRRVVRGNKHIDISNIHQLASHQDILKDVVTSNLVFEFYRGLKKIPSKMANLLEERFVREVPSKVIANRTGKSIDAIDRRVAYAKQYLKREMGI